MAIEIHVFVVENNGETYEDYREYVSHSVFPNNDVGKSLALTMADKNPDHSYVIVGELKPIVKKHTEIKW